MGLGCSPAAGCPTGSRSWIPAPAPPRADLIYEFLLVSGKAASPWGEGKASRRSRARSEAGSGSWERQPSGRELWASRRPTQGGSREEWVQGKVLNSCKGWRGASKVVLGDLVATSLPGPPCGAQRLADHRSAIPLLHHPPQCPSGNLLAPPCLFRALGVVTVRILKGDCLSFQFCIYYYQRVCGLRMNTCMPGLAEAVSGQTALGSQFSPFTCVWAPGIKFKSTAAFTS